MKKNLILITLFVTLLQSCTKDPEPYNNVPINTYYYLTAWQLNQTPYFTNPAFDTISYASDKGDTLTFVKTKTDTTWYREGNPIPGNLNKNCYQTIHNSYVTIKGVGSFDVKHSRKISHLDLTDVLEIKFHFLYFLIRDFRIGSKTGGKFYDSLIIGNRKYKDVIDIFHNLTDSNVAMAFINKDFGLFSIKNNQTNSEYNYITK